MYLNFTLLLVFTRKNLRIVFWVWYAILKNKTKNNTWKNCIKIRKFWSKKSNNFSFQYLTPQESSLKWYLLWELLLDCNHSKYTLCKQVLSVRETRKHRVYPQIVIFCHFESINKVSFSRVLHIPIQWF